MKDIGNDAIPDISFSANLPEGAEQLFRWLEDQGIETYNWYMAERKTKARASKLLRIITIFLVTAGGTTPAAANISGSPIVAEWGFIFLGAAAGVVLLDKSFGFSSAWARYMASAQSVDAILKQLEISWVVWKFHHREPGAIDGPAVANAVESILIPFARDLARIIEQETAQWAGEFSDGLMKLRANLDTPPLSSN